MCVYPLRAASLIQKNPVGDQMLKKQLEVIQETQRSIWCGDCLQCKCSRGRQTLHCKETYLCSSTQMILSMILELSIDSTGVLVVELVVLHTTLSRFSFFGARLELVWKFEQQTFHIGSLRVKLILASQEVLKWVWPSVSQYIMWFIQTSTPTPRHALKTYWI